jgi:hypothetical protein
MSFLSANMLFSQFYSCLVSLTGWRTFVSILEPGLERPIRQTSSDSQQSRQVGHLGWDWKAGLEYLAALTGSTALGTNSS